MRTWLQLVRLPAVFTAMADVFLGFSLTHDSLGAAPATLALLLVVSSSLYLAGMVFNDVFDVAQDTRERPQRPIPSGRITRAAAARLGMVLVAIGLIAAVALHWTDPDCGWNPLLVAVLILLCVLLYDGVLKSTLLGPVLMGSCRFFNVLLGASAAGAALGAPFHNPPLWVAAGLGAYIVGVTWFARREAVVSRSSGLIGGAVVVNLGLIVLLGWVKSLEPGPQGSLPLLLLGVVGVTIDARIAAALTSPSPMTVQRAVRTMLLSIITLDASLVYAWTGDGATALTLAVVLTIPALTVGRLIRIT